jgi:hypothetical protein
MTEGRRQAKRLWQRNKHITASRDHKILFTVTVVHGHYMRVGSSATFEVPFEVPFPRCLDPGWWCRSGGGPQSPAHTLPTLRPVHRHGNKRLLK